MRVGMDARLVGRGLGIATFITELAEALQQRGDLDPVWLGDPGSAPRGWEVAVAPARWPYPMLDLAPGRRLARRLGLDAVHFTANTGWLRKAAVPTVLTVHDLIYFESSAERAARQRVGHAYLRWAVPRAVGCATALTAISETTAAEVRERFGRGPTVIPHGIRRPLPAGETEKATARYLVAFGARDPRKGTDLALEVWRRSRGLVPRLQLVARAGLPPGFEEVAAKEIADGSVVIHRSLDRPELERLLAGATALLYLSTREGFGLPVLEAMACGAPVITGLAAATREVGGDAALYVEPGDPVGAGAALVEALATDPSLRAKTVEAGNRRTLDYSWAEVAEAYAALYSAVAS